MKTAAAVRCTSCIERRTLQVTRHTTHDARLTSHVTRHTSHVTRHLLSIDRDPEALVVNRLVHAQTVTLLHRSSAARALLVAEYRGQRLLFVRLRKR